MDKQGFDRLEVKRKILEASQKGKIPTLSYGHFEIINPYPVDSTLVEYLDDGSLILTDELFFECLKESPHYLAYEPFRERIKAWQAILHSDSTANVDKSNAKSLLEKVGKTLAWIGAGRPAEVPKGIDVECYWLAGKLKLFLDKSRSLTLRKKRVAFEEAFPDYIQYLSGGVLSKRSHKEIALNLIRCKYKISIRELRSLLKNSPFKP
ncbi:MAG: hypothetical protein ABSF52_04710 [Syntrophobacteraceae bacterium]|jgi:hypothetical protein